jgi:hypothetical protein
LTVDGGEGPLMDHGLVVEVNGRPRRLVDPHARPLDVMPVVTPVPLSHRALAGLAQVDGEVLPVIWPGEGVRAAAFAVLTETTLGRVLVLCGRVLPDELREVAEPLSVDPIVEEIRHTVRV